MIGQAHPYLRVHEETVVQVDDTLPNAGAPRIDLLAFFTLPPLQAVYPKKVSIGRLDDVFLGFVAPEAAKLHKVGGITY